MNIEHINPVILTETIKNDTTIEGLLVGAECALLHLVGTSGTISFGQKTTNSTNYEQLTDNYTMSGTECNIPLVGMTINTLIKIETTGTITAADIQWGE